MSQKICFDQKYVRKKRDSYNTIALPIELRTKNGWYDRI